MTANTPDEFFADSPTGLAIWKVILGFVRSLGDFEIRVSKSQIALRRRRGFAYVWRADRYVRSEAPAVLGIALPQKLDSARFKEVAHPATNAWMHHLELRKPSEVDAEVQRWLRTAYEKAS